MNMMILIGLMLSLSLAWVVWFLKNPLADNDIDLRQSNIGLGKQRKAELQRDLEQDLIDQEQFDLALEEISSTLAIELNQSTTTVRESKPISALTWLIVIMLPIFSIGVYQSLSTYSSTVNTTTALESAPLSLEQSAEKIKQHLVDNPSDAQAWKMLGLSYFELNKIDESLQAYEKAYQLNPKDARLLVEYASTMISANDDQFTGRPVELIKQALEIEPNAPDALYLAGLFAVSMQDFNLAKGLWNKALAGLPEGSVDRQALLSILAELEREQNPKISHTVTVNVAIADEILAKRSNEDFLMVYVKSAVGRPMPIAIEKIKIKDFSGQVSLSDMNSVMPTKLLSEHDQVLVVARLSRTGGAMKQADDLQVVSDIVSVPSNPTVNLTLD
ncbi:MAG: c-type cytochrome biogenesis protein CcmI [Candidatus Thioglobus sp.]|uniref:c-type cytochrome biogenesis protein CcmI n=1 Tax=Candidatus Thioglobus sp. TaxID=2026721 RepID=UPI002605054B|nr:c-type cytochrome biogenesis protein CcmI [Candidatus Thioglobus sp.]MDC9727131.1 c-type cytochrome biogenesis protein CcmI [Candidatus Thioglobus sp.]